MEINPVHRDPSSSSGLVEARLNAINRIPEARGCFGSGKSARIRFQSIQLTRAEPDSALTRGDDCKA